MRQSLGIFTHNRIGFTDFLPILHFLRPARQDRHDNKFCFGKHCTESCNNRLDSLRRVRGSIARIVRSRGKLVCPDIQHNKLRTLPVKFSMLQPPENVLSPVKTKSEVQDPAPAVIFPPDLHTMRNSVFVRPEMRDGIADKYNVV